VVSVTNISKMGDTKLVIYVPTKYHEEMKKSFKGKPMLVSCQEAILETEDESQK
jgi:hypothetical protein